MTSIKPSSLPKAPPRALTDAAATPQRLPGEAHPHSFDARELLRIDVDAEIRKLSQAQLQGPWQLGAECVRVALQCGAAEVELQSHRNGFRLKAPKARLPEKILAALAALLDPQGPQDARHRALEIIESSSHPVLLCLVGLRLRELKIEIQTDQERLCLQWRAQAKPRFVKNKVTGLRGLTLVLRADELQKRAFLRALFELCRFCPLPLRIDGKNARRGLEDVLGEREVLKPTPGRIAILREGEDSRVWLLQDGVIRAHLSLPRRPWFVGYFELSRYLPDNASPADLRTRFERDLPHFVDQSIALLDKLCQSCAESPPEQRQRLARITLLVAQDPSRRAQVMHFRCFCTYLSPHKQVFTSLAELTALTRSTSPDARAAKAELMVGDPQQSSEDFPASGPILLLAEKHRALFCEVSQISLIPAPLQHSARGQWRRRLQEFWPRYLRWRLRGGFLGSWARAQSRWSSTVSNDKLSPELRRLVASLQGHLAPGHHIEVVRGQGAPTWNRQTLFLPRKSPLVERALEQSRHGLAPDDAAIVALLDGRCPR